ncbi:hypothetical protein JCM1840_003306 [Sporobolomyces johnsonii]
MTLTAALLLPLHLLVLLLLHTVFALLRLLRLVSRLRPSSSRTQLDAASSSPTEDLRQGRWSKVPRHLAVVLAPTARRAGSAEDVAEKREQLARLMRWCSELSVEQLTVFDRDGVLVDHADSIAALEGLRPLLVKAAPSEPSLVTLVPVEAESPPRPSSSTVVADDDDPDSTSTSSSSFDEASGSSTTLVPDESGSSPIKSTPSFTLRLLSRKAGRPRLARLAQELASARLAHHLDSSSEESALTSEQVAEAIDAFPLPEPDLLFVFGGPYLRLHGFPPWQIRLSEMYHYPSPAWLPPPDLTYPVLRRALDVYGRAEMRLGR